MSTPLSRPILAGGWLGTAEPNISAAAVDFWRGGWLRLAADIILMKFDSA
jgi:hypothetical protein